MRNLRDERPPACELHASAADREIGRGAGQGAWPGAAQMPPPLIAVTRRERSISAPRFVPLNECHLRRRFPVAGSRMPRTMAHWPGDRSRMWPLMLRLPVR
jgi:hypothetical protein